ncbi:MAG: 3-phosphoshikimate 1-carboxyvinyltransferase [Fidelibacterota bacterium]
MAVKGTLAFSGDKSISHRALMLASLAKGKSDIFNLSTGLDVTATQNCLVACGIEFSQNADKTITVFPHPFKSPRQTLDCQNSGTTTRLLLGLLAGQGIQATFKGDTSLSQRPMKRILEPLSKMGLRFENNKYHLPITIGKSQLKGIYYSLPVASAQVKSSLLLAGLGATGTTTISEDILTRNHTEIMLRELGATININGNSISVEPLNLPLTNFQLNVPGDPSSAAFLAAATVISPHSELTLKNLLLNPTRIEFFNTLKTMGAQIEFDNLNHQMGEKTGDVIITPGNLRGISINSGEIPGLIDELPILAITATQAEGETVVRGAQELRKKESDRISAICNNLKRMGANITELEDGFIITGPTPLRGLKIQTFGDHRIAMAFTIAGLISNGPVILDNPNCMSVSFPQFRSYLKTVVT